MNWSVESHPLPLANQKLTGNCRNMRLGQPIHKDSRLASDLRAQRHFEWKKGFTNLVPSVSLLILTAAFSEQLTRSFFIM